MTSQVTTLDGLPKQFVTAMRTLFDIMDDKRLGYVDIADIENRWQEGEDKVLPKGVVENLKKVTPANGMLTFERFCAGLKLCLNNKSCQNSRPTSAPILDKKQQQPPWIHVRPNNVMSQQRTLSMPQLKDEIQNKQPVLYGPPKPPRSALNLERTTTQTGNIDRTEIRTALQNWQKGLLMNDENTHKFQGLLRPTGRSMGDGKASTTTNPASVIETQQQPPGLYKKNNARRREPRRHTLQNGIDYSMLKRMKQIEQEKEVLMQGLTAVEKARDWYLKQISLVQDKMKYLGKMGYVENWSESQQERLELQRARVLEVNRYLTALTESWERGGLPLHMNLAVHYPHSQQQQPQEINERLKRQNRLLTEEVSKKSERISALEREKTNLIQLLQMRSTRNGTQEEAVF